MANKFKGQAELSYTVEDDDGNETNQVRKLQLDANAFCEIEEATGHNLGQMLEGLQDPAKMSMRTVRGIVYGALQRNHPSPDLATGLRDAGDVISNAGLETVMQAIRDAATGAMGGGSKKTKGKTAKPS